MMYLCLSSPLCKAALDLDLECCYHSIQASNEYIYRRDCVSRMLLQSVFASTGRCTGTVHLMDASQFQDDAKSCPKVLQSYVILPKVKKTTFSSTTDLKH